MIKNIFRTTLLALAISMGGAAATTTASQAGSLNVDFSVGGPGFYFSSGRGHRRGHGYRGYRDYRGGDYGYGRRICAPRRALRKARRMGVRGARIARVNYRVIVVRGYRYGERAKVKFGRSGRCPVIAFRTR